MDSIWSSMFQSLGIAAILIAAVAWLARALVVESLRREAFRLQEQVRRDTEASLEDIRHRASLDLESYRHTLELRLAEHGVRFQKLHERRFELIASLYAAIEAPVRTAARCRFLSDKAAWGFLTEEELVESVRGLRDLLNSAWKAFAEARLYLPEDLDTRIADLLNSIQSPLTSADVKVLTYQVHHDGEDAGASEDARPLDIDGILSDLDRLPRGARALTELANKFRGLLGVPIPGVDDRKAAG